MLSILLQTENLNNLTESVNKVTDSSIRIAQAANDFGALRVAFGVFMIFIIIIVILFIWQIFVLSGKLNTIYGAAVKTTEYFETSAEGDIGPSQAQVIVRRNFNSLSQAIKYYILRIRLENHIDDKNKIKVKRYLANFELVKERLKEVEEKFVGQDFFRVHQSHFINLNHIDKIYKGENAYLVMKDGTQISISRHRKDEFLDLIKKI